jgi:Lantibiotic dehydratase, N terminus
MLSGYIVVRRASWPLEQIKALAVDFKPALLRREKYQQALTDARKVLLAALDEALINFPPSHERTVVYNVRKLVFQGKKTTSQSILALQSTNLSVLFEQMWLCELECQQADAEFEQFYLQAWMQNRQILHKWAQDEQLKRALLFSSHDLLRQLSTISPPTTERWDKNERSTVFSLLRYGTKMATQTTPLSRFATVNLQALEPVESDLKVPDWDRELVKITPNVALLPHIYKVLLKTPAFRMGNLCRLNPSIERTEGHYYWCHTPESEEQLQKAATSPLLDWLYEQLQTPHTSKQLSAELAALSDAAPDAAEQYVLQLIEKGFLTWVWPVDGYSPSWCGQLYQYLGFLAGGSSEASVVQTAFLLQWLRTAARTLPYQSVQEAQQTQVAALEQVTTFFEQHQYGPPPEFSPENLFYEDVAHSEHYPFDTKRIAAAIAAVKNNMDRQPVPQHPLYAQLWTLAAKAEQGISLTAAVRLYIETNEIPFATPPTVAAKGGWVLRPAADGHWQVTHSYAGTGKLAARWLHLFPARYVQYFQEKAEQEGFYTFPYHSWFNANFQPALGKSCLLSGSRSAKGALVQNWRIKALPEGELGLFDAQQQRIQLHDPGLEAQEAKPLSAQLLFAAGVSPHHLGNFQPTEKRQIATAYFINPVRLNRSLEWLWLREKLSEIGLLRPFFVEIPGHSAQYIDPDSPMLMQLFAQLMEKHPQAECTLWSAEWGKWDYALEVVVED